MKALGFLKERDRENNLTVGSGLRPHFLCDLSRCLPPLSSVSHLRDKRIRLGNTLNSHRALKRRKVQFKKALKWE